MTSLIHSEPINEGGSVCCVFYLSISGCCCVYRDQEGSEGGGLSIAAPDFVQLDDLGQSTSVNQDTCVTLIQQIRTAMIQVSCCPERTAVALI